ncbi:hypothetical protein BS47DRAFT_1020289 [Hydnum rufescens UP504]|uniref:malate synthase n=1 Tax=Hydnum rufescens UP504 TaxID=1448309 RepID=A0A9P6DVN9_9AGAM|nr:hypothetical protein BS47DRAFT_1020289 [Hydnum rufescens UP504]
MLPDRKDVTMEVGFMDAYVRLLIQTCHKRKVAAMGGMSTAIPIKEDPKANEIAMAKVRADKSREVTAGHDGTWVAHPPICSIAMDVFNDGPNQYHVLRSQVVVAARDLLDTSVKGSITEDGVKGNVSAALETKNSLFTRPPSLLIGSKQCVSETGLHSHCSLSFPRSESPKYTLIGEEFQSAERTS